MYRASAERAADAAGRFDVTGPHAMLMQEVQRVEPKPGAYILGNDQNRALYVGRANANLRSQLMAHLIPLVPGVVIASRFWYEPAANQWDAYLIECRWYHQFAPTHNAGHPARPLGAIMGCPVCGR